MDQERIGNPEPEEGRQGRCLEGRQRHSFAGGDVCVHCGAMRTNGAPSAAQGGPGQETVGDIGAEIKAGKESSGGRGQSKWTQRQVRKSEEERISRELAKANARQIIRRIEDAKRILARVVLQYEGNAITLEIQEEIELVEQLTRYLELTGFSLDSPKVVLLLLVSNELSIGIRQFLAVLQETGNAEQDHSGDREQGNRKDRVF